MSIIIKIFNSIDNKHEINIKIIDDVSWFNIIKLDFENIKTFLLLLKQVIEYLNLKNIQFIKQYIYQEDLYYFKNSDCSELNDNQYVITTKLIYFVEELTNVLGIQKI
jgi:hypothetical protein